MKLLFDCTELSYFYDNDGHRAGVFNVSLNILKELQKRGAEITFYCDYRRRYFMQNIKEFNDIPLLDEHNIFNRFWGRLFFRTQNFPIRLKYALMILSRYYDAYLYKVNQKNLAQLSEFDAYLSPFSPPSREVELSSLKRFRMIHDTIPIVENGYPKSPRDWHYKIYNTINDKDFYVTNSDCTKRDVLKYFPFINDENIKTTLLGANENFNNLCPPLEGGPESLIPRRGKKYTFSAGKRAKELRNNQTKQEFLLWQYLRKSQLGYKFRRQQPIGNYIVDFMCPELKLIVELDGGQHNELNNIEYDKQRTAFLESCGYKVMRFWNNDIDRNIEGVVDCLKNVISDLTPPPNPLPQGAGEEVISESISPNPLPQGSNADENCVCHAELVSASDQNVSPICTNTKSVNNLEMSSPLNQDGKFKYIFSLCTLGKRKNIIFAIKNFFTFIEQNNIQDLKLVLGGGVWKKFEKELFKSIGEYDKSKLIFTGYIDDEDLPKWYSNALMFIYPSLYEGFGLPVLEAMQSGCPVITSNTSSLPEVIGDCGITINPASDIEMIEAYEKMYFDSEFRTSCITKGLERAKEFSWEKCTNEILEFINHKLNQPLE